MADLRHPLRLDFPFLAGFIMSVNFYLIPAASSSPRMTDLTAVFLGFWILYRLSTRRLGFLPLAFTTMAMLFPLVWAAIAYLSEDQDTLVQGLRWILAIPWAVALLQVLQDEDSTAQLAWGLVAGSGANVLVIILQAAGFEHALQMVGLSSSGAAYHFTTGLALRLPGMHGHHGASSAIMSLVVPAAMYLYLRGKAGVVLVLTALGALMVGLHLSSTRSPLVITALSLGFALLVARRMERILGILALLVILVIPVVAVVGPPGGWSRWTDQQAVSTNAHERWSSNVGAAALTVSQPWGHGVKNGIQALADRTSQSATHNAFLQAGLVFGLPFCILVLTAVIRAVARASHGPTHPGFLPGLLAFHFAGLAMFEEHLNNPTFIIMTAWFIAALVWSPPRGRRPSAKMAGGTQD